VKFDLALGFVLRDESFGKRVIGEAIG